jgi:nicotinamide-nucleotide amidase
MRADIITIGDEILIGQVVDTNATYLGKTLNNIGNPKSK